MKSTLDFLCNIIDFPLFSVPHAGDLIALGSKTSGTKPSLRHAAPESEDSAKPSKSSAAGGNPSKKFKSSAISGDNAGGLFSDPIRVSQVSQQAVSVAGKQAPSKSSHGLSPQPSGPTATQQIIEGACPSVRVCMCSRGSTPCNRPSVTLHVQSW